MKSAAALATAAIALGLAACAKPPTSPNVGQAASGELSLKLTVDKTAVHIGDELHITLTAQNNGLSPINITSRSGALMLVTLWEYDKVRGWVRVKQYPEASTFQLVPWRLKARSERTFESDIPVEQDWPTDRMLRLTAELNGQPQLRPYVMITVAAAQ